MQKKKIVTIILSVVLCIAIGVLGFVNVFRIDSVSLDTSALSEDVLDDVGIAEDLRAAIEQQYLGQNTLFVNQGAAESVLRNKAATEDAGKNYAYLRITGFYKAYPNHIVVQVKEDEEMFCVQDGTGYRILSADGVYLASSTEPSNRGKYTNVLVSGLEVNVALGTVVTGDSMTDGFVQFVKAMAAVDGMGGSIRSNVVSIEVSMLDHVNQITRMRIKMKEGVVAYVSSYEKDSAYKANLLVNKYLSLEDTQKVTGMIRVGEVQGNWVADYDEVDRYAPNN